MNNKIFKPDMEFKDNNRKSFYSGFDREESFSNNDPKEFINSLAGSGYIFGKRVVIVTNDDTLDTKIATKTDDYIITIDNKKIYISDIKDIYRK